MPLSSLGGRRPPLRESPQLPPLQPSHIPVGVHRVRPNATIQFGRTPSARTVISIFPAPSIVLLIILPIIESLITQVFADQTIMPNPRLYHRKSIRYPGFDYSSTGAYFVTLTTASRHPLFGNIINGVMEPNPFGHIVEEEWEKTPLMRPEVELGVYQIMPDHFHAVIIFHEKTNLTADQSLGLQRKPRSLGSLIAGFKAAVTRRINQKRNFPNKPVWQRNYYDRIIRNEEEWERIHLYIMSNPDRYYDP